MTEALLYFVVDPIVSVVCYLTAWLLLPMLTLGRLRAEPIVAGGFKRPGVGKIVKQPEGHWMAEAGLASALGLLIWGVVGVSIVLALS